MQQAVTGKALQNLTERIQSRYGIPCRFACPASVPVADNDLANQLFLIAQEAAMVTTQVPFQGQRPDM